MEGLRFNENNARRIWDATKWIESNGMKLNGGRQFGQRPGFAPVALVQPTSNATGGGRYNGVIWDPTTAVDATISSNLAASDLGASGGPCLIYNLWEVGASTHSLVFSGTLPLIFLGFLSHVNSDGTPVYAIQGIQWGC